MTNAQKMLAKALNHGGDLLGHMVMWTLVGAKVEESSFKATWGAAGLDEKYLPDTPTPGVALRDAGNAAMKGHTDHLWLPAAKTSTHVIFAVLHKEPDGAGNVPTHQVAQVAVDGAGQVSSDHPEHPIVKEITSRFAEVWGSYQHRDVTTAILNVLRDCAVITLRDSGGVYFVPSPFAEKVEALKAAIEKVGSSTFVALPISDEPTGKAATAMAGAAKGSLEAELADLRKEIDAFTAEALAPGKVTLRASTVERRLEAFSALRDRAELYRSVLAVEVGDLDTAIAGLEEQAQTILTTLEAPDETPSAQGSLNV